MANLYQTYKLKEDDRKIRIIGHIGKLHRAQFVDDKNNVYGKEFVINKDDLLERCSIHDVYYALLNKNKFIAVPVEHYLILKTLIKQLIRILGNNEYIECEIPRKRIGQDMKMHIVVALKNETLNNELRKKSATKGYAKKQLSQNSKLKCCFCDCVLTTQNATTEHIIPFSVSKNNSPANFAVSCLKCNNERGTGDFFEFVAFKRRKILKQMYPDLKIKKYKLFV